MSFWTERLSRRRVLKILAITPELLLAACSTTGKDTLNSKLAQHLAGVLELNPQTTRESFARWAHGKTYAAENQRWNTGVQLGTFSNIHGKSVPLATESRGESNFVIGLEREYAPPYPIEKKVISFGQNTLVVYGSVGTVSRFELEKTDWEAFLSEYFALSKAEKNYFHLNVLPARQKFTLEREGLDPIVFNEPYKFSAFSVSYREELAEAQSNDPIKRHDIGVNLDRLGEFARIVGLSREETIAGTLANEWTNMVADHQGLKIPPKTPNEAPSTLAGWLVILDERYAPFFLGGEAYKPVVKQLVREMKFQEATSNRRR